MITKLQNNFISENVALSIKRNRGVLLLLANIKFIGYNCSYKKEGFKIQFLCHIYWEFSYQQFL